MQVVKSQWEEDQITSELYLQILYVWKAVSKESLSGFAPQSQLPVYPKKSKRGKAPSIDFAFRHGYEDRIYFAFECKRVDHTKNSLISGYIKEGILRFINEVYSTSVSRGGMIGYLFSDTVGVAVEAINEKIKDKLSQNDCLIQKANALDDFQNLFFSQHIRSNLGDSFGIYHLFFVF